MTSKESRPVWRGAEGKGIVRLPHRRPTRPLYLTTAPGFITINGMTLGEEGLKVGFINEHEVEPLDMEIKTKELRDCPIRGTNEH